MFHGHSCNAAYSKSIQLGLKTAGCGVKSIWCIYYYNQLGIILLILNFRNGNNQNY